MMDQGSLLPSHLSAGSEYTITSDNDGIDAFTQHQNLPAYTTGGAVDRARRDGTISHPAYDLATRPSHGARFAPDGGVASELNSFRPANSLSDSNSGSISTSPSSGVSPLSYNTYQTPSYTNISGFGPGSVTLPQSFAVPSSYAGNVPRMQTLQETITSMPLHPVGFHSIRSPIPGIAYANDRDFSTHPGTFSRAHFSPGSYTSYSDTPRTVAPLAGLPFSHHPTTYLPPPMATTPSPQGSGGESDCARFPFPHLEGFLTLVCNGQIVTIDISAKVDKGFFPAKEDNKWTCYRRNYFGVTCSYTLHPNINNGQLFLRGRRSAGGDERVKAIAVNVEARVDGSQGKKIELIQHTPRRDAGEKWEVSFVKLAPQPPGRQDHMPGPGGYGMAMGGFHATGAGPMPELPFQVIPGEVINPHSSAGQQQNQGTNNNGYGSPGSPIPVHGPQHVTTFDRIQFKQATANNGKRRASQQYFVLDVQVYVDVRQNVTDDPSWVKVASRTSDKVVVRGRSPSHYQGEATHNGGRNNGGNGNSSYPTQAGPSYSAHNTGGFRAANSYAGPSSYGGSYGGGHYAVASHDSPESPDSVEGGASDEDQQLDVAMREADRDNITDAGGYSYHPGAIYEGAIPHLPLPKVEGSGPRFSTEPGRYAVSQMPQLIGEYPEATPGPQWQQLSHNGRYQGYDTSRGFFPDMGPSAGSGYQ